MIIRLWTEKEDSLGEDKTQRFCSREENRIAASWDEWVGVASEALMHLPHHNVCPKGAAAGLYSRAGLG